MRIFEFPHCRVTYPRMHLLAKHLGHDDNLDPALIRQWVSDFPSETLETKSPPAPASPVLFTSLSLDAYSDTTEPDFATSHFRIWFVRGWDIQRREIPVRESFEGFCWQLRSLFYYDMFELNINQFEYILIKKGDLGGEGSIKPFVDSRTYDGMVLQLARTRSPWRHAVVRHTGQAVLAAAANDDQPGVPAAVVAPALSQPALSWKHTFVGPRQPSPCLAMAQPQESTSRRGPKLGTFLAPLNSSPSSLVGRVRKTSKKLLSQPRRLKRGHTIDEETVGGKDHRQTSQSPVTAPPPPSGQTQFGEPRSSRARRERPPKAAALLHLPPSSVLNQPKDEDGGRLRKQSRRGQETGEESAHSSVRSTCANKEKTSNKGRGSQAQQKPSADGENRSSTELLKPKQPKKTGRVIDLTVESDDDDLTEIDMVDLDALEVDVAEVSAPVPFRERKRRDRG